MQINKLIINYISLVFLVSCFISCMTDEKKRQKIIKLKEEKTHCNLDSLKPFTKFLIGINEDTLHLRYDLKFNPVFKKTLDSPKISFEEVKTIIACSKISSRKKGIAIVSMSKLDLESRIDLLSHCYNYYGKGVNYTDIFDALAMEYYYYRENPVFLDYENMNLRELLERIVSEKKEGIDYGFILDILSGKRSRILKHRIKTNDYSNPQTRLDIPKS